MNEAWSTYLDNLYREQSKLYADVQAARTLGLSDDDIRRNLINGAKLGKREANAIIDGRFEPGEATSELAKEINRLRQAEGRVFEEETLYFDTFNQMSQDRTDQPLRYEGQEPVAPAINFDDLIPQQQETPAINFDDLIPQRQGSILPAPAVPTGQAKLSPSLLGDNPVDVARNMEIATASR
jgi:hypothetical protein